MNHDTKYKKIINGVDCVLWSDNYGSWITKKDQSDFTENETQSVIDCYGEPYKHHSHSLEYIYGFIDYKIYDRNMSEKLEEVA